VVSFLLFIDVIKQSLRTALYLLKII